MTTTLQETDTRIPSPEVNTGSTMIKTWRVAAERLEVTWDDDQVSNYAYPLLRDWCSCDECIDRQLIDSESMLTLPLQCTPRSIGLDKDGALRVTWQPDNHKSEYDTSWLRTLGAPPVNVKRGYSGVDLADNIHVFDYEELHDESNWLPVLEAVGESGFAMLNGVPGNEDEVAHVGINLGYVPGGWRYSANSEEILVAAVKKDASLKDAVPAMSEEEKHYQRTLLVPHTDFSFTSWPTGLFIFHCMSPSADHGGESILVDGFHVAERLRVEDPEAFELLSTVRQPFCGHGSIKIDWRATGRVISVDDDGEVTGIRFALASRMPLQETDEQVRRYYRATQSMLRLLLDPACQIRLALSAGDCLVLDNHRILHGRTGMDPVAGLNRKFRRFDVERDAAQTHMLRLARSAGRKVEPLPSGAHC